MARRASASAERHSSIARNSAGSANCPGAWPAGIASTEALARAKAFAASATPPGTFPPFSFRSLSSLSVTVDALKKSLSSRWKMRNSSTNSSG